MPMPMSAAASVQYAFLCRVLATSARRWLGNERSDAEYPSPALQRLPWPSLPPSSSHVGGRQHS